MFYFIDENWIKTLEANHQVIKSELINYLNKTGYNDLKSFYSDYSNNNGWLTIPLIFFTINNSELLNFFPETKKILKSIPELITAEFSILKSNTLIQAHEGYSKEIMRTHLGLKIPNGDLALKCMNHQMQWKEGKTFSFNDGYLHEAWNNTTEDRWVLMIDTPIPNSNYTARQISEYKINNLNDKTLLSIAPKETWLNWLNEKNNIKS